MKNKGFTLIELMIVIAILGIIVGLAYPAYTSYLEKSRRADAISGLMTASQQMERCFTRFNAYNDGNCSISNTSPDGHYEITVTATATSYTLTANPGGAAASGAQSGDVCGSFTLDHLGIRGAGGAADDKCWGSS